MNLENLAKAQLIDKIQQMQQYLRHTSESIFCYEYSPPISTDLSMESQIEKLYDGFLIDCNENAVRSYGYSNKSEILGKTLLDLFKAPHGSLDDLFRAFIEEDYATIDAEGSEIMEDGSKRYFLNNTHAEIIDNAIHRVWGTYREITKLKKVEEKLKESEEKYRHLIEESLLGVAILQGRKYVYVNSAFAKTTGFSVEELLRFSPEEVWNLTHIEDHAELENRNIQLEKRKPVSPRHRFRYVRKNGEIRWVESLVTTIEYKGKPALQVFENDITDKINTEIIQKELEERRENFITMTSHELRTPLTVISGYLSILLRRIDEIEPKRRDKILNVMQTNINRLERLVAQVSLLSQFEQDIFTLNKSKYNLAGILEEIIEPYAILLGEQFRAKGMKKIHGILIDADKDRLMQVLENVLNNAIDHTSPKKRLIELSVEIKPEAILMKVKDNGAGIAAENLEQIFDQFVSFGTDYSAIGTGVGLYLSKLIMQAHNGKIFAQSKGLGYGSEFTIELPR